jgi:hypothetical protein
MNGRWRGRQENSCSLQQQTDGQKRIRISRRNREICKKQRCLVLFVSLTQKRTRCNGWVPRWRLASMVKESLIPILKETSCYVVISLGRNFVARRYLRDWDHAWGADHRYSDPLGEKGLLRPSCRDETRHLRWQKADGILFCMVTLA